MVPASQPNRVIALCTAKIHNSVVPAPDDLFNEIPQLHLVATRPFRHDRAPYTFIQVNHALKRAGQNRRSCITRVKCFPEEPLIGSELRPKALAQSVRTAPMEEPGSKLLRKLAKL